MGERAKELAWIGGGVSSKPHEGDKCHCRHCIRWLLARVPVGTPISVPGLPGWIAVQYPNEAHPRYQGMVTFD